MLQTSRSFLSPRAHNTVWRDDDRFSAIDSHPGGSCFPRTRIIGKNSTTRTLCNLSLYEMHTVLLEEIQRTIGTNIRVFLPINHPEICQHLLQYSAYRRTLRLLHEIIYISTSFVDR